MRVIKFWQAECFIDSDKQAFTYHFCTHEALARLEDKSFSFSELVKIKVLSVEHPKNLLTAENHHLKTAVVQQTRSEQNPNLLSTDSVESSPHSLVVKLCSQVIVLPHRDSNPWFLRRSVAPARFQSKTVHLCIMPLNLFPE